MFGLDLEHLLVLSSNQVGRSTVGTKHWALFTKGSQGNSSQD